MRSYNLPLLNRRKFLTDSSIGLAAIAATSAISSSRLAWAQPSTEETVEVKTAYGGLRGKRHGDLITFKGIPLCGRRIGTESLQSGAASATVDRCS